MCGKKSINGAVGWAKTECAVLYAVKKLETVKTAERGQKQPKQPKTKLNMDMNNC